MSILVDKNSRVLCQGITGTQATFHIRRSLDYGTNVVAGVTPGKGGNTHLGLPVFNTVKEAVAETGANASVMYVPAPFVKSAVKEAVEAELDLAVCIADSVPLKDMLEIKSMLISSKHIYLYHCPFSRRPYPRRRNVRPLRRAHELRYARHTRAIADFLCPHETAPRYAVRYRGIFVAEP